MSFDLIPMEIICIIADELDNNSLTSFSLTCTSIHNDLSKTMWCRKKIKKISDTMSNDELEKINKLNEKGYTEGERKIYLSVLQDRKEKGIFYEKGYIKSGRLWLDRWYSFNKPYRPTIEGTATIEYHEDGQRKFESWWVNDKRHRPTTEGPAVIEYYPNGHRCFEHWVLNNQLHRPTTEGPAVINYYVYGHIASVSYYENGILINK